MLFSMAACSPSGSDATNTATRGAMYSWRRERQGEERRGEEENQRGRREAEVRRGDEKRRGEERRGEEQKTREETEQEERRGEERRGRVLHCDRQGAWLVFDGAEGRRRVCVCVCGQAGA